MRKSYFSFIPSTIKYLFSSSAGQAEKSSHQQRPDDTEGDDLEAMMNEQAAKNEGNQLEAIMNRQAADVKGAQIEPSPAQPPSPAVMNPYNHRENHDTPQPGKIDQLTFSDTLYRIRCGEFFTHNDPLYGYRSKSRQSHINKFKAEFESNPEKSAQIEATLAMRQVYRKIRHLSQGVNREKPIFRKNCTINLKEEFQRVQEGTKVRKAINRLINDKFNCSTKTDGLARLYARMQIIDAKLAKQTQMKIDSEDVTTLFKAANKVGNDGMIVQKKTKHRTRPGHASKRRVTRSVEKRPPIPEKPTLRVSSMSTAGRGVAIQSRGNNRSASPQPPGYRP